MISKINTSPSFQGCYNKCVMERHERGYLHSILKGFFETDAYQDVELKSLLGKVRLMDGYKPETSQMTLSEGVTKYLFDYLKGIFGLEETSIKRAQILESGDIITIRKAGEVQEGDAEYSFNLGYRKMPDK